MARQLTFDLGRHPDQQQPHLQVPGGDERTINDASRPIVAAHRIDGDSQVGMYCTSNGLALL
jgi:hypothetical protein